MHIFNRTLKLDLPPRQSAFLWGPRKTGKSFYLKKTFKESVVFDLLDTDLFLDLTKRPAMLRERLLAMGPRAVEHPVIIDEVQKIPRLLDEVHKLIESTPMSFILCGSSARKLKRGRANMLGGRAWRFELFPLTSEELGEFQILDALNRGLIPAHYSSPSHRRSLKAYLQDYLKEEVFDEGLIRNIPAFARFFDAMGFSHGELTNYSNIARECGVHSKTVKEYYQILVDTLLGRFVEPFSERRGRRIIGRMPKFYLFDVGVAGALTRRRIVEERGDLFGRAFEHFIFMELSAYGTYKELGYDIQFWRTTSGLEVDFILGGGDVAIEVKSSKNVSQKALRPLRAFIEEYSPSKAMIVCNEPAPRISGEIRIVPYRQFLKELWSGEIIC